MQRGVSPVIATILLLLITVSIAIMYYTWVTSFTSEQISDAESIGSGKIKCSDAGITITRCTYDKGGTELVSVTIENTGAIDLNGFRVIAMYTDETSDYNDNKSLYLDVGASGMAYMTANANKTVSRVKVIPLQCRTISDTTSSCG